jgi:hypothetical protein
VTLFGEVAPERRDRLRRLLAEQAVTSMIADGSLQASEGAPSRATALAAVTAASEIASGQAKHELFYTPASGGLVAARQAIAAYSFERAAKRLRAERATAGDADACRAEDEAAQGTYSAVRRFAPLLSQVGCES